MFASAPPSYSSRAGSQGEPDRSHYAPSFKTDDDRRSTKSRSSDTIHSVRSLDTLKLVSGGRVRKGKCTPEFLQEIAKKNATGPLDAHDKSVFSNVKIITGNDAMAFFKRFLGESEGGEVSAVLDGLDMRKGHLAPVVFAVTVWDLARKIPCLDYYMPWRGKREQPRRESFKGVDLKIDYLDEEFRRVAKAFDREYKRATSLKSIAGSLKSSSTRKENVAPSQSKKAPPPEITVQELGAPVAPFAVPEPPVSANDSVMSLPLLNMVRGVPLGNRLPLRITNPDPETASVLSSDGAAAAMDPSGSRSLMTLVETAENAVPQNRNTVSAETLVAPAQQPMGPTAVRRTPSSVASSSESRSSRSSKTSRSDSHRDRKHDDESSSKRKHRTSSHERYESGRHEHHKSSKDSHHHHHSSSRRRDKPASQQEFVIVLLDEKADRDVSSWHGVQRNSSSKSLSSLEPVGRHSPWSGPLARSDGITHRYPPPLPPTMTDTVDYESSDEDDESSEDEAGSWKNSPVIPLKPLMQAMGYASPDSAYRRPSPYPITPSNLQYQPSIASHHSSPAGSYAAVSPYPIANPSLPSSPYVPAWLPQHQHAPSRPASRASYAPLIYASPYVQPHAAMPY